MGFGLSINNPSGRLVVSSDAYGLYCIGKAALQGSIVQPSGSATASSPGREAGYSVYRIAHNGPILVALDLPLNTYVAIESVTQPFAGTWDIRVQHGTSLDADDFISTQTQATVWAYGYPVSAAASGFGLALYRADGSLGWDLGKDNPLFLRHYTVLANAGTLATIPSLSRPVAIGAPSTDWAKGWFVATNTWSWRRRIGAFRRTSATQIYTPQIAKQYWRIFSPEAPDDEGDQADTPLMLVDGSYLP